MCFVLFLDPEVAGKEGTDLSTKKDVVSAEES